MVRFLSPCTFQTTVSITKLVALEAVYRIAWPGPDSKILAIVVLKLKRNVSLQQSPVALHSRCLQR